MSREGVRLYKYTKSILGFLGGQLMGRFSHSMPAAARQRFCMEGSPSWSEPTSPVPSNGASFESWW